MAQQKSSNIARTWHGAVPAEKADATTNTSLKPAYLITKIPPAIAGFISSAEPKATRPIFFCSPCGVRSMTSRSEKPTLRD